jgi:hypothetical protein
MHNQVHQSYTLGLISAAYTVRPSDGKPGVHVALVQILGWVEEQWFARRAGRGVGFDGNAELAANNRNSQYCLAHGIGYNGNTELR